jgi:hypothetical protein
MVRPDFRKSSVVREVFPFVGIISGGPSSSVPSRHTECINSALTGPNGSPIVCRDGRVRRAFADSGGETEVSAELLGVALQLALSRVGSYSRLKTYCVYNAYKCTSYRDAKGNAAGSDAQRGDGRSVRQGDPSPERQDRRLSDTLAVATVTATTQPMVGPENLGSYLSSSSGTSTKCQGAVSRICPRTSSAHVEALAIDSPGSSNSAIAALAFGVNSFSARRELTRWPRRPPSRRELRAEGRPAEQARRRPINGGGLLPA